MNLLQATEITGLVIGVGGVGTVLGKGFTMARRFGHFLDKLAGNGDSEPGILKRLEALKVQVDDLRSGSAARDSKIDDLTTAVAHQGEILVAHVDGEAPSWRAEGEAWGNRIDKRLDALESKVDPVTHTG